MGVQLRFGRIMLKTLLIVFNVLMRIITTKGPCKKDADCARVCQLISRKTLEGCVPRCCVLASGGTLCIEECNKDSDCPYYYVKNLVNNGSTKCLPPDFKMSPIEGNGVTGKYCTSTYYGQKPTKVPGK